MVFQKEGLLHLEMLAIECILFILMFSMPLIKLRNTELNDFFFILFYSSDKAPIEGGEIGVNFCDFWVLGHQLAFLI